MGLPHGLVWWLLPPVVFLALLAVLGAVAVWRDHRLRRVLRALAALGWRRGLRGAWALARDRRVPWAIRLMPLVLLAYLSMPFDLIPDFIPVLGQVDDVLLVASVAWLVVRFTPREALREHLGVDVTDTVPPED